MTFIFHAQRERWWKLHCAILICFETSKQAVVTCLRRGTRKLGWRKICTWSVFFCVADERCGIIVSLIQRAAAGLVWMLWLSCTIHWEQNLLVISEANHQTALKRNHNKPKRNLWKAVRRGTIGAGLVHICDSFAYYFLVFKDSTRDRVVTSIRSFLPFGRCARHPQYQKNNDSVMKN